MRNNSQVNVVCSCPISPKVQNELNTISDRLKFTFLSPSETPQTTNNIDWLKTHVLLTDQFLPNPNQVPNLKWVNCLFPYHFDTLNQFHRHHSKVIFTSIPRYNPKQWTEKSLQQLVYLALHPRPDTETIEADFSATQKSPLTDKTVGIIGYGSLGRQLARDLQAYKVTIYAASLDAMNPVSLDFSMPGNGDPEGIFFNRLYPLEAVGSMLTDCDYVFLTLPDSPRLARTASPELILKHLPTSAMLVDTLSRPQISIDYFVQALRDKKIAGVGFQNLESEPHDKLINVLSNDLNLSLIQIHPRYSSAENNSLIPFLKANFENFLNEDRLFNQVPFELLV